jgi:hypothetical protein
MGNAWLKFMAEERANPENKDVPMLKLASHARRKPRLQMRIKLRLFLRRK